MAEFCLECFNKYIIEDEKPVKKRDVILGEDLCEGCGEWKPCVIRYKKSYTFIKNLKNKLKRIKRLKRKRHRF